MNETLNKLPVEKRNRIIIEALSEFGRRGYENASTNNIVKAIGISKGSLFKYFESKEKLYLYLLEYTFHKLIEYLEENSVDEPSIRKSIIKYASIEYDFLIENPIFFSFFFDATKRLEENNFDIGKDVLVNYSKRINDLIFKNARIDLISSLLLKHIKFVLNGYNQHHFSRYKSSDELKELKSDYMYGLEAHLDLIKW